MPVKKRRKTATNKAQILNKKQIRLIAIAVVILVFLVIYLVGPRGTIRMIRVTQRKHDLQEEIQALEKTKVELDSIKNRLENDPTYLEKVAREEYNMKKEGEKVIRIESDTD
ncbi:MAG: septum formation initiator family protein [Calditrichaceae bacterium]|jgi:cell division protein FtsB